MKKCIILLALCLSAMASWAFSFSVVAPSGQTLYYNINGDNVSVTCPGSFSNPYTGYVEPTGNLVIPSTVVSDGITYAVTELEYAAFRNCSNLTSVTLPNSVTSIGMYVFQNCTSLTNVIMGDSLTTIGSSAFSFCSSLSTLSLPSSITEIGNGAFSDCTSLTSVTLPNSLTRIEYSTFIGCSNLASVIISNSVTSIGASAFFECTSLVNVLIPSTVSLIEESAFEGCSSLVSVTILGSVDSIANRTFADCVSLTSVSIPNSVSLIGNSAFIGCSSLAAITIPSSVDTINGSAFESCIGLNSIYCEGDVPPVLSGIRHFRRVNQNVPVYVPCGSGHLYLLRWGRSLSNFIEPESYTIAVSSDNQSQGQANVVIPPTCTNTTLIFALANTGYVFRQWSDGVSDNPRWVSLSSDTAITASFGAPLPGDTVFVGDTTFITYHDTVYNYIIMRDTIHVDVMVNPTYRTLTVASGNQRNGSVSGNGIFPEGTQVEIAAIPNQGCRFVSWQDGNTDNPRHVELLSDMRFVATFESGGKR